MRIPFIVLDARVVLSGPEELVGPIAAAYDRFVDERGQEQPHARVEWLEGSPAALRIDGSTVPLISDVDPVLQLYGHFVTAVLDQIERFAVLHCAALRNRRGEGVLLAGSAGYGKSSLALELASRGLRFLGDDYAPVNLLERSIHPYPRRVGIRREDGAPIPESFRRAARSASAPTLLGKRLLDVGQILGEQAMDPVPAPLRHVVVLAGPDGAEGGRSNTPTRILVAGRASGADALGAAFDDIPGVLVESRESAGELVVWKLGLDHAERPSAALDEALDRSEVLLLQKYWDGTPDFETSPEATELRRHEAAGFLGREILNRRRSGRFMRGYGGDVAAVFLDVASSLRDARCRRVRVGRFGETADLIDRLVGGREG